MRAGVDQLPLPVVPDGARRLGPLAWLVEGAGGGQVFIGGQLSFAWDAGDDTGRRLAAALLVKTGAAAQQAVAAAFGVTTTAVYGWRRQLAAGGAAGLAPVRKGPKGPSKLGDAVVAGIRARREAGESVARIAAAVGCSQRSVARVLAAARPAGTGGAGGDAAGRGDGDLAGDAGGEEVGADAGADVLWVAGSGAADAGAGAEGAGINASARNTAATDDAACATVDDGAAAGAAGEVGDSVTAGAGDAVGGEVVFVGDAALPGERDPAETRVLPVLPDPVDRGLERGLARAGLLGEAAPVFAPAARVPLAGLLLAVPALAVTGLIDCARRVYGSLPAGFYGLSTMLVEAVFRALAGESRAEGTGRIDPAALGRVLGMDRAPEVTTIRRKMRQLAARERAAGLLEALASRQLADAGRDDTAAILYVDGHTRVYRGKRKIQKLHVSRLRFPAPATEETWVCDSAGAPVWMVMAEPGSSLASEISRLLPDVRRLVGDDRRVLVAFDRGGWSPALFAGMIDAGFDVLTWRKGAADDVQANKFGQCEYADEAGRTHTYLLAETTVVIPFDERKPGDGAVTLRQISKLDQAAGRQVHVLTSSDGLAPAETMWKMSGRWRQENWFRYGRLRFDLDAHDTYRASDDDADRMVPNPAKKPAYQKVTAARAKLQRAEVEADRRFLQLKSPQPGETSVITNQVANHVNQPVFDAQNELATAKTAHQAIPARLPLAQVRPGQQVLETETKQITHAIRTAAFNTMNCLAATVRTDTGYSRAADEAHNLIRTALKTSGDIDPRPGDGVLHVRLDPLPTPRATNAIAELCHTLNAVGAVFPGTNLKLHYTVKTDR